MWWLIFPGAVLGFVIGYLLEANHDLRLIKIMLEEVLILRKQLDSLIDAYERGDMILFKLLVEQTREMLREREMGWK